MEIFVIDSDQIIPTEKWNDAQGSSLTREAHEKLKQGKIVCVDKRPCKVKLFCECEGVLKSLSIVPDNNSLNELFQREFGLIPKFEEAECFQEV